MRLLESTDQNIENNKNSENVPRLKIEDVALTNCNVLNSNYQQASKVLFTFVPDKQFGQLITISPHSLTILKLLTQNLSLLSYGLQIKIIDPLK